MTPSRPRAAPLGVAVLLLTALFWQTTGAGALEAALLERTYQRLDAVRERKQAELSAYLKRLQTTADGILVDRAMAGFFRLKRDYYHAQQRGAVPAELEQGMATLKVRVRDHYMRHYMSFYDILCIDRNGDIFYTVRQERDYHKNLFRSDLAQTALARQLRSQGQKTVVDYQYYSASDEPSAFFVEPVKEGDELLGWFVLQCTINKLNSMFSQDNDLGLTGEIFLVNRQQYMLTDSRFFGESSILKRHLSPENIEAKFKEGRGHKIVTDYRGCRAITSFDTCPVGDTEWLLIAKIDEDEVLTEAYREPGSPHPGRLVASLRKTATTGTACAPYQGSFKRVDMDEFKKAGPQETLGTFGVSTCTAVVICYPGRFAYMGHLSCFDRVYGQSETDLIGHMLKRIRDFDLPRARLRHLCVTIVAPHLKSLPAAVDLLLAKGFLLSQIRMLYRGDAAYATVHHVGDKCRVVVHWKRRNDAGATVLPEDSSATPTLAQILAARPANENPATAR